MARPGAKPKPALLRLVDGSHRNSRHGNRAEKTAEVEASTAAFGKLKRPTGLKGNAAKAWKEFIEPSSWLDGSRGAAAHAFCALYGEFLDSPKFFPAAKHNQLRAYMNDLGLTDERNRGKDGDAKKPKSKFFDD
jgi:hypothetical protein